MKKRLISHIAASSMALGLFASTSSYALDSSNANFAGFASFGYEKSIKANPKNRTEPTGNISRRDEMFGLTRNGDYRNLTKMGIRMDVDMDDNLSFAAQMIVRGKDNYEPSFDWLYLSYQFNPELSLTLGRFIGPVFLYSDSYEVAYAWQWVELPYGTYNSNSFPIEGAKLTWETSFSDEWSSLTTMFAGDGSGDIPELNGTLVYDEVLGASWELSFSEWLTLRTVYFTAKSSLPVTAEIAEAVNSQIPASINLAPLPNAIPPKFDIDDLAWENERIDFYGIGLNIDTEHMFFTSEYTYSVPKENNIALHKSTSWYASAGIKITPTLTTSITYTASKNKGNQEIADNYAAKVDAMDISPFVPAANAAAIRDELKKIGQNITDSQELERNLWVFGLRWDFNPKASVKLEYLVAEKYAEAFTENRKPQAVRAALNLVF